MSEPKQQGAFFQEPALPKGYHAVKPPSKTEDWATPAWLFSMLDQEFHFTIDVAAAAHNTKCARYYDVNANGLEQSWAGERVWCNPPWDCRSLTAFTAKAVREKERNGVTSVFLMPVKSDQRWWHEVAIRHEVRFILSRVAFDPVDGVAATAPIPVAIVVIGPGYNSRMLTLSRPQLGLPLTLKDEDERT